MIIQGIITRFLDIVLWLVNLLPKIDVDFNVLYNLTFVDVAVNVKRYMNFFLTTPVANFVIWVMFITAPVIIIFTVVKLVRYFIPVV